MVGEPASSEGAADPDVGSSRFDWLVRNLRCPGCGESRFDGLPGGGVRCGRCRRTFDRVNGAVDFLDDETRAAFGIVDTENVSDHPYDGNATVIIDRCAAAGGYVLDCGSGYKSRRFPNVIQMEIVAYPSVDVLATNQRLPFRDGAFDAVFSIDVLEHVTDPWGSAREILRVLRPGGYLYVDIPFLQHEHGYPNHYFNATRSGLLQLFDGAEVLGHQVPASGSAMHTVHSVLQAYRVSLPTDLSSRFEALTVAEILATDPTSWQADPVVTELAEASRWVLASTTQALLRKPGSEQPGAVGVDIQPVDLPGFLPPPHRSVEVLRPPRQANRAEEVLRRAVGRARRAARSGVAAMPGTRSRP